MSLFGPTDTPPLAARLAPALRSLAEKGVFFGTSSWKYEGWLGSIYTPERYLTRKKFSKKKFEAECIREYAATFPTVGGDFSFYQFPSADTWARVFDGTPPAFTIGLKVPEEVTVPRWPAHARYGKRAGLDNVNFLNATLFQESFTSALEPHKRQVAALIFEFGTFAKKDFAESGIFFARLEGFLGSLPRGWRYAVEIRNADYLVPEYFATLSRHNVAHVFNAWTRMPTIGEQIALPEAWTADFALVRALLQKGRTYDRAVAELQPYRELKHPDLGTRAALCQIALRAIRSRSRAYVFVNNRLEGNAPTTIDAVASMIGTEECQVS
jgi:uncharacterized protein YecE (DUF72 family)